MPARLGAYFAFAEPMAKPAAGLKLLVGVGLTGAVAWGCVWDLGPMVTEDSDPTGPVAESAEEAWPEAPADVVSVHGAQILEACALAGSCSSEAMALDLPSRLSLVDLCVFDAVFSAERAVPLSGLSHANERLEYWVGCVLGHSTECSAIRACRTDRDPAVTCEEAGCRSAIPWQVRCEGSVALLEWGETRWQRDCARAFSQCDEASPTGCSDRLPTTCPVDGPVADWCDGNVRLGCDGTGQVSYHDCERMGGSCLATPEGVGACSYLEPSDPECSPAAPEGASCDGGVLSACVNGRRYRLPTALCPAPADPAP